MAVRASIPCKKCKYAGRLKMSFSTTKTSTLTCLLLALICSTTLAQSNVEVGIANTLIVDPDDAGTVYACSPNGMYKSVDFAETWTRSLPTLRSRCCRHFPNAGAIDAWSPCTCTSTRHYGAIRAGVFVSGDSGT